MQSLKQLILNLANQCSLFVIVRHIVEIGEDDLPRAVNGEPQPWAQDYWWTLDVANAVFRLR
jgi:hypothetical protein